MISRRAAMVGVGAGAAVAAVGAGGAAVALHDKPEPPSPPSTDGHGHLLWRNWSGVQKAYPSERLAPTSAEEVAHQLKAATAPIRAVGAGHSFTGLVPTSGALMTLDGLGQLVRVDGDIATVQSGMRLGALGPALAAHGRAMANLPDINKQSLGGALATGTHGTGKALTALHGDVVGLTLATAGGELIRCDAKMRPEVFEAARVSLGSLGVLTEVSLRTTANARLHRRVWVEPMEQTLEQAEARWARHRNYEFYAVPFTGLCANITHDVTDEPARPRGPDTDTDFLKLLQGLRNLLGFAPGLRKTVAHALLAGAPSEEAIDEGWRLLSTERPVRFNEMEYHLPADAQLSALREVVATIEKHRPDVFFPIELRRIAPDAAWLSPFQGGPRGSVAVHCHYKDEFAFLYELIEPIFRRHDGRPHWGKLHSLHGQDLAALYPRWKDFLDLRRSLDPDGRLLNLYLRGLFEV